MIGWDIGGVNTKVALVAGGEVLAARGRPYEVQRAPDELVRVVRDLALEVGALQGPDSTRFHCVTMTAELSHMFRTKRQGVAFVLDAMELAFPSLPMRCTRWMDASSPRSRAPGAACVRRKLSATARIVLRASRRALVDVGSTTTDIIPIVGGHVVADGWTDPERLATGELG